MPDNSTINMNLVDVLLIYMKTNGKSDNYLRRVRQYFERIKRLDPTNENYRKLSMAFEQMVAS